MIPWPEHCSPWPPVVDGPVPITELRVRLIGLPLADTLAAAHDPDPDATRELVILEARDAEDRRGFGECSALNQPGYTPEWARGAFAALQQWPHLHTESHPMATAGVEMARVDLVARRAEVSLASLVGHGPPTRVPAGVVIGLGSLDATVAQAEAFAAEGYRRLKLKITPAWCVDPVEAVHRAVPQVELHVDGNASFGPEHIGTLAGLADWGVAAIEQPFAVGDPASAQALVALGSVLVVADEAATDPATVRALIRSRTCTAVSIKPPRLGGLGPTLAIHDDAVESGVALTVGGMLECGLGRHGLAAVAALPGCTLTGDLSPARRWLADDPWPDLVVVDGEVTVPIDVGVAPDPDLDCLERYTLDAFTLTF